LVDLGRQQKEDWGILRKTKIRVRKPGENSLGNKNYLTGESLKKKI